MSVQCCPVHLCVVFCGYNIMGICLPFEDYILLIQQNTAIARARASLSKPHTFYKNLCKQEENNFKTFIGICSSTWLNCARIIPDGYLFFFNVFYRS